MSSTTSTTTMPELPFDVLGIIFHLYGEAATLRYPVETLLLVCRSWNEAAVGHCTLWNRFNIRIGHRITARLWKARIPRRLERCGPSLSLHIDIRNLFHTFEFASKDEDPDCDYAKYQSYWSYCCWCRDWDDGANDDCASETFAHIEELLAMLTGQDGELCARWESLTLDLGESYGDDTKINYRQLEGFLCHPTPRLVSLGIYSLANCVDYEKPIFPYTPNLHSLTLLDLPPISLTTCPSIRSLKVLSGGEDLFGIPGCFEMVEEIVVEGYSFLPEEMRNLKKLKVRGTISWRDPNKFDLSNLTHLSIHPYDDDWLEGPLNAGLLDCSRLISFDLHLGQNEAWDSRYKTSILNLLFKAKKLTSIGGDRRGISVILKLLWETEMRGVHATEGAGLGIQSLLTGRVISVSCGENSVELQGRQTCAQLSNVAGSLKVMPPDTNWNEFEG